MEDCVFCAIVAGEAPARVVDENEHTMSFLDIAPFTRGHTLVIPRRHAADVWDVDGETFGHVMAAVHRVAHRLRVALSPHGMNLLQSTRSVAFQTVFHLHVHVIPRWSDDPISLPPWPKHPADPADLDAIVAAVDAAAG